MSARVSTTPGPDGRLMARKQPATEHEAAMLAAAQHPGVVELVAHDAEAATLDTVFAGPHSLATVGRLELARTAVLVAGLVATLADLHALDVVHGRVEPSHVVLGAGGRALLCGFAGSGRPGTTAPTATSVPAAFADPAAPAGAALDAASDVYGLGALVRFLLAPPGDEAEAPPGLSRSRPRAGHGGRHRSRAGWSHRALLALADHATEDDPRQRPTAAAFAAALAADDAGDGRPAPGAGAATHRPARWVVAAAGAAIVLAGVVGLFVLGRADGGVGPRATPAVDVLPAGTGTTTVEPAGETAAERAGGSPGLASGWASGWSSGVATVVSAEGERYAVGRPGDRTVVGDWDCDGRATVALLRPGTGEVYVFDGWAGPGRDLTAEATARLQGAARLATDDPDGDGCVRLLVVGADGSSVEVPP